MNSTIKSDKMQQPKAESTNFSSKFQETVFQLVEKIEEEIWYYDVDGTIKSEYGVKYIEMKNQAARVQNVLKLCIQQIELIFCLPQLISNESKQLTELCTNEEIEEIGKFFRKYSKQGNGTSDDFDGELHKYLDTAHRNKIFELIKRYSKDISPSGKNIILLLNELLQIGEHKIMMSASREMAKQKVLHNMWTENDKNMQKILQIRNEIEQEQNRLSAKVNEKRYDIDRYQADLKRLKETNTNELTRLIAESNNAMSEICEIGKGRQQAEAESMIKANEMFDILRKNDLCEEEDIQIKKTQLEHQLKDFMNKYDRDIGDLSLTLHLNKKELQAEESTLAEWKEKYDAQEKIYNRIVAEKEIEEAKIREEKLLLFMMNRAARTIQTAYRRVLHKRKKKKGKGKKPGKK